MINESDEYKALKELLTEDRPVSFRPVLKRITGNYCAALVLAQLLYWTPRSAGEWIYKTDTDLGEEICASRGELGTARAVLTRDGLVEAKRMGQPAKMHYRVNLEAVISKIAALSGEPVPSSDTNEEEAKKQVHATSCRDSQLQGFPATSCRPQTQTSCRDSLQLSITETTTETTPCADARASTPSGRDPMDTHLAFEDLKAHGRAAGKDDGAEAHPLAGTPHLVALCQAFEREAGFYLVDLPKSRKGLWRKDLEDLASAGVTADDMQRLISYARSHKWQVLRPGSLTNAVGEVRRKQGCAQPRQSTELQPSW